MKLSDVLLRVVLLVSSFASSSAYDIIHSIVIGGNSNATNGNQLSVTYEDYVSCLWAIRTHFAGENPTTVSSYVKDDSRIFSNAVYRRDDIVSRLFAIEIEIEEGTHFHLIFQSEDLHFVGWTNSQGQSFIFKDCFDITTRADIDETNRRQSLEIPISSHYNVQDGLPLQDEELNIDGFFQSLQYLRNFTYPLLSDQESIATALLVYVPVFFSEASRFNTIRSYTQRLINFDLESFHADEEFMNLVNNWNSLSEATEEIFLTGTWEGKENNTEPHSLDKFGMDTFSTFSQSVALLNLNHPQNGFDGKRSLLQRTGDWEYQETSFYSQLKMSDYFKGISPEFAGPIFALGCKKNNWLNKLPYCDTKFLWTAPSLSSSLNGRKTVKVGPFSEEGKGQRFCPSNMIVTRIKCSGKHCDKMTLYCVPFVRGGLYSVDESTQITTKSVSDENRLPQWCDEKTRNYVVNGISCDGRYCDNVKLHCIKVVYTSTQQESFYRADYSVSPWFSEESGGLSVQGPINAIQCDGRYCDNKSLVYDEFLSYFLDYSRTVKVGPFSEEGVGSRICPTNMIVSRIKCSGDYCDKMTLYCSPFKDGSLHNVDESSQGWRRAFFSEEQDGLAPDFKCAAGSFVNGIACTGRYCDNIKLHCVQLVVGLEHDWYIYQQYRVSPWFSEESGGLSVQSPINAIQCGGRYCDNKSLVYAVMLTLELNFAKGVWIGPFSEEGSGYRMCPQNYLVIRIKCTGRYCDNMRLYCVPFKTSSIYQVDKSSQGWRSFYSEEQDGLRSNYKCAGGYFVNGIACQGRYCDNIKLHCVKVTV